MSATESRFRDWQAEEEVEFRASRGTPSHRHRPALLVDDDFSWSEPAPRRRSRRAGTTAAPSNRAETATVAAPHRAAILTDSAWDETGFDFDHELDDAWDDRLSTTAGAEPEYSATTITDHDHLAIDYIEEWDESTLQPVPEGRRTVVITGHGQPEISVGPRRRRDSGLRVYERSGFNPDRVAMWAFVLGVVLIFGAIIH